MIAPRIDNAAFAGALSAGEALLPLLCISAIRVALMRFVVSPSCGSQEDVLCGSSCALNARYKLASSAPRRQRQLASCKTLGSRHPTRLLIDNKPPEWFHGSKTCQEYPS